MADQSPHCTQQPAPPSDEPIKPWQERMPEPWAEYQCTMNCGPSASDPDDRNSIACGDCSRYIQHGDSVAARDAEIAELRARVAALGQQPAGAMVRKRIIVAPRAPAADRFARARQALQQAIDKCADAKN